MTSVARLRGHLGTLAAILWNYGGSFAPPTLDEYDSGEMGFRFAAALPGADAPKPAELRLAEVWAPVRPGDYRLHEYAYDFIDYPFDRRRAFHRHDPDHFVADFGVVVHEHCEERLGRPECAHYYGLPVDAYEAIRRLLSDWGQPGPLGCRRLRCLP